MEPLTPGLTLYMYICNIFYEIERDGGNMADGNEFIIRRPKLS